MCSYLRANVFMRFTATSCYASFVQNPENRRPQTSPFSAQGQRPRGRPSTTVCEEAWS